MMARNEHIDAGFREGIKDSLQPTINQSLSNTISVWTKKSFKFRLPAIEVGTEYQHDKTSDDYSLAEKTIEIQDFVFRHVDDANYYIIFDELDEDYTEEFNKPAAKYMDLLTGLFKAVQDVLSASLEHKKSIRPVVLLRDDIYNNIQGGSDKTKWQDFIGTINWDTTKIKELLAFRISKAAGIKGAPLDFDKAWFYLFEPSLIGNERKIDKFDYIRGLSLGRPRDFIHYLKLCAASALKHSKNKIESIDVKQAEIPFSSYLRSEFEDELHSELPNVSAVFKILKDINRQTFSYSDYSNIYNKAFNANDYPSDCDSLAILYKFGVIGYYPKGVANKEITIFNSPNSSLNIHHSLFIHRGLYKSLQIY